MTTYTYVNEAEKFWDHSYNVMLADIGSEICVNADNEQDALDYAVDYAEEQGWEGYFLDTPGDDMTADWHEDDICYAGNHGRALLAFEIHIKQLD